MNEPVLDVRDLVVCFEARGGFWRSRRGVIRAVDGVSLAVAAGQTLGLVGESGCGKSSVARAIVGLVRIRSGTVKVAGRDLASLRGWQGRLARRSVQMIFQDPYGSLNPRRTIGKTIQEAVTSGEPVRGAVVAERVDALLAEVGLEPTLHPCYPHELSGGQRQRVAIARALAARPCAIVADEPTSALDVTVQARILRLLREAQRQRGLALLLISHDLTLVRRFCRRIAVMYLGRIVELFPVAEGLRPLHPYSHALAAAAPSLAGGLRRESPAVVPGAVPSFLTPPSGCPYHPRCPRRQPACQTSLPALEALDSEHLVRCPVALREKRRGA
jgi:oligopeptide/dipeptide ABC transporter ATP-binding protein